MFLLFSQYGHPIEAEELYYLIIKIVIYERHEAELLFVCKRYTACDWELTPELTLDTIQHFHTTHC